MAGNRLLVLEAAHHQGCCWSYKLSQNSGQNAKTQRKEKTRGALKENEYVGEEGKSHKGIKRREDEANIV